VLIEKIIFISRKLYQEFFDTMSGSDSLVQTTNSAILFVIW
jgi:hypothetical protein